MSAAFKEIGAWRALRFVLLELAQAVHGLLLLPPLRAFWLRLLGARIGRDAVLLAPRFSNLDRRGLGGLVLGRRGWVGRGVRLDLADAIELGDDVTLADEVLVLTHLNVGFREHPLQAAFPRSTAPVRVGAGAFVGARAILLPGVRVGERAFVAAGAVVTHDVEPGTIVAGNPARVVGRVAARVGAPGAGSGPVAGGDPRPPGPPGVSAADAEGPRASG